MKVTEAKFTKYEKHPVIGFASIVLEGQFKVTGIVVFKKEGKISISMPSKKSGDKYYETVYPLVPELRAEIVHKIKAEVEKECTPPENETDIFKDDLPF